MAPAPAGPDHRGMTKTTAPLAAGNWTSLSIGDLSGKTFLITGANSGLGLESAKALAFHGGTVIMAGRNETKLNDALGEVVRLATGPEPLTLQLDLASLASVREAAEAAASLTDRIDVLLNNAGVMAPPLKLTEDGFESQIGTNHLGHYALTGLVLPLLHHSDARVVNVSSVAHRMGDVDPDDLNYATRSYQAWSAYGQSKLANLLFTSELDRRAKAAGWDLIAAAAHPGFSATNLQFSGPAIANNPVGKLATTVMNAVLGQSAEAGAWPQLYAATGPDVVGDDYFGPSGLRETRGNPKRVDRRDEAKDAALAARLWEVSAELTGVEYDWS